MSKISLKDDGFNQLCEAKHGYYLYNKYDTAIGHSIATYGEYTEGEIELFRQFVKPGDAVIEAGANIGTHTLPLSRMVGDLGVVFSFEAQRIIFQTLCANLALNSIQNVYAYNLAVGDADGTIMLPDIDFEVPTNMGGYSLRNKEKQYRVRESVPLITLDTFMKGRSPRVTFIMADIEKMEAALIKGARHTIAAHRPIMYMESHPSTEEGMEAIRLLQAMDYRVFHHVVPIYNPSNHAGVTTAPANPTAAHNVLAFPADRPLECANSLKEIPK